MQELTGARILVSEADAALLASGGTNDFTPYSKEMMGYRPAKADRILRDGDKVTLVNNAQYPGIAEDLAASYTKLKSLPCDVFLAPHTGFFNLTEKAEGLKRGAKLNPFIDSTAFKTFIGQVERKFLAQLESEQKGATEKKASAN